MHVERNKLEGELDSLIVHETILNRIVVDLEKVLSRSREEKRKLSGAIEAKKKAFSDAFGYNRKYQTDESQPNDVQETTQ